MRGANRRRLVKMSPEFDVDRIGLIIFSDIKEDSQPLARSIVNNLNAVRTHYLEYIEALALRELCARQSTKEYEEWKIRSSSETFRESPPNVDGLWSKWEPLAVRAACMALRDYLFALEPLQRGFRNIEEWRERVDGKMLRDARRRFDEFFPNIERARHSVAHPEGYNQPNHGHAVKGTIELPDGSVLIKNASAATLKVMTGSHYMVTYKGQVISVNMSPEASRFLKENVFQIYKAFEPIVYQFSKGLF